MHWCYRGMDFSQAYKLLLVFSEHESEFCIHAVCSHVAFWSLSPSAAPKIDSGFAMRDIVVLAGEEFTIRVPYSGSPAPEASWTIVSSESCLLSMLLRHIYNSTWRLQMSSIYIFQNGNAVLPDDRIHTEVNVAFTVFLNKKAKREDSGKYTLTLKNPQGSDTASCKVLVVGKYLFLAVTCTCTLQSKF